jgi:hypothetical protein
MKVINKFYKNSNTGELVKSQQFTETSIIGIPVYFYNTEGKCVGENLTLEGFVEIKEKKFKK